MKDIALDSNGDILFENGVMRLTDTLEESSRQQVLITLRTYRGEWQFNTLFGIPYLKNDNNNIQILGAGDNKSLADSFIREGILSAENVVDIESYTSGLDKASGAMTVSFTAVTNTGSTITVEPTEI